MSGGSSISASFLFAQVFCFVLFFPPGYFEPSSSDGEDNVVSPANLELAGFSLAVCVWVCLQGQSSPPPATPLRNELKS